MEGFEEIIPTVVFTAVIFKGLQGPPIGFFQDKIESPLLEPGFERWVDAHPDAVVSAYSGIFNGLPGRPVYIFGMWDSKTKTFSADSYCTNNINGQPVVLDREQNLQIDTGVVYESTYSTA